MVFDKLIHWADRYIEKLSLFHVILLSCFFALISIIGQHGGVLNPEMYLRLPFYLSDTPLLNKLYDSRILDHDMYRARELSYFLDFIDSKFIEFSIENGFPHFLSLTHYLFSIAIGCLLWMFCVKELNLKPLRGIYLLVLFWTFPSIFFGGSIFRAGKVGVALLIAILFYVIYKVVVISTKGINYQISKNVWLLYFIAIFTISFLDEQGLFFAVIVLVFLTIWGFFVRHKNIYVMFLIGVASVILHLLYRYTIAPQLTFMLNGYWPNFTYQKLPIQYFIQNLGTYLSVGLFLDVETFRTLIGNPAFLEGFGLFILFISFPVFYLYTSSALSANDRKFFILAQVELLITNFSLVIMNALMVLKQPLLTGITLTYYWLPTNVMFAMTLATIIDIFYKSRIPKLLVLMVICFAITGNIVALPKHKIIIRQGQMALIQPSSALLNALKNLDSLDDVRDPLIRQNPVFRFFKSKKQRPPVGVDAYNEKGVFYTEHGEYRRATENFNKAIIFDPNDIRPYINRGYIYFFLHQYKEAIEDLNEAIRLKPDYAETYTYRGSIYFLTRKNELGCRDAQKVCELGKCTLLEQAKSEGLCR